jgi:hypothetical protein
MIGEIPRNGSCWDGQAVHDEEELDGGDGIKPDYVAGIYVDLSLR